MLSNVINIKQLQIFYFPFPTDLLQFLITPLNAHIIDKFLDLTQIGHKTVRNL